MKKTRKKIEENKKYNDKNSARNKTVIIPDLEEGYWHDIYPVILKLSINGLIQDMFDTFRELEVYIPQICLMIFKSNQHPFREDQIYGVFFTHYVDPQNTKDIIGMNIYKKCVYLPQYVDRSRIPYSIKFLEDNANDAIMITFTEEDIIDCEMWLLSAEDGPAFDFHKLLRFYEDFDPEGEGYIPYIVTSKGGNYKGSVKIGSKDYKVIS